MKKATIFAHHTLYGNRTCQTIPIIAVIDDDKSVRDATQRLLRTLGYHASTFASGDEFLKSGQIHNRCDSACEDACHRPVVPPG